MSLVLDSSVTRGWVPGDAATDAIRRVFDVVVAEGAIVPGLWRLEVAGGLSTAVRRRRINLDIRNAALAALSLLDITIDMETNAQAWAATLRPADKHGLTLYDAACLERAARKAVPLAPLDTDLRMAANRPGVVLPGT